MQKCSHSMKCWRKLGSRLSFVIKLRKPRFRPMKNYPKIINTTSTICRRLSIWKWRIQQHQKWPLTDTHLLKQPKKLNKILNKPFKTVLSTQTRKEHHLKRERICIQWVHHNCKFTKLVNLDQVPRHSKAKFESSQIIRQYWVQNIWSE